MSEAPPSKPEARAGLVQRGLEAWTGFWHDEIDAAPLAAFRQAFAWTMLIYFWAWSRNAEEWLTASGYHPPKALDALNAPLLPLLPMPLVYVVGVIFFGSLIAYIFGFARRILAWVILAGAVYALQVDPISAFTMNRLFVICWFVLAIAPEARVVEQRSESGETELVERQRAWPTRMIQVLVLTMYCTSGLCKSIHGHWWGGEDVLWVQVQGLYMNDFAAWLVRTLPEFAWVVQQELALWFELLAPLLFVIKPLRPVAFVLGLGLHIVVALTMDMLIYFSLQMMCFYLLFIPPQWARRLVPGARPPRPREGSADRALVA